MRIAAVLACILVLPTFGLSKTIHVPKDHAKIQDAIDAAVDGDTVLVAPGTYVENIDFKAKAITIASEQGFDATTIDGNQTDSVVSFIDCKSKIPVLEGFKITNGKFASGGGVRCYESSPTIVKNKIEGNADIGHGAGIACFNNSSPTISDNVIINNLADLWGGGIYCSDGSSPTITNNHITGNWSSWGGGGIYCQSSCCSVIRNNTISNNTTDGSGGAICCRINSSPEIKDNLISGNVAEDAGAIHCSTDCSPNIIGNIICENTAGTGGGITIYESTPYILSNIISNNSAKGHFMAGYGGGIVSASNSTPVIVNNIFTGNEADEHGGAICSLSTSSAIICNSTICSNASAYNGGGIYCFASTTVVNSILWDNGTEVYGDPDVTYSDIKGGFAGSGNIDADPLFIDPDGLDDDPSTWDDNDFHIAHDSPCRNTGNNSAPGLPMEDSEGDPRIAYGTADMGADEFHTHLYWKGDAAPGGSAELKFVGIPTTSPVKLWLGFGVMEPPMKTKYGDWYLKFPLLADLELGSIPPPKGLFVLPFTLPNTLPTPLSLPFQAGIGMELTNLSVMDVE